MAAAKRPGPGSNGAAQNILRDPGISHGPFKVLPYAPGGFVIHDTRAALGQGMVGRPFTGDDAKERATDACRAAAAAVAAEESKAAEVREPDANSPADVGFKG